MPNIIYEDQIKQAPVQKLQHLHGFNALDCGVGEPRAGNLYQAGMKR